MIYTYIAIGMALGFGLYHILATCPFMWRRCCRAHFKTHTTCQCADCVGSRQSEE